MPPNRSPAPRVRVVELVIGLMGLGISALLPHLGQVSALVLLLFTRRKRLVCPLDEFLCGPGRDRIILLTPITLLMGGR